MCRTHRSQNAIMRVFGFLTLLSLMISSFGATVAFACASGETVQRMYIAYYGRPGDPGGISYWQTRLTDTGCNLGEIIDAFGTSAEYQERFGTYTGEQLVENIYLQLLGRAADPGGLDFYAARLALGEMTLASIALDIMNGVREGTEDYRVVQNKIMVADYFSKRVQQLDAIYGNEQIEAARQILENVDSDQNSVALARSKTDQLLPDNSTGFPQVAGTYTFEIPSTIISCDDGRRLAYEVISTSYLISQNGNQLNLLELNPPPTPMVEIIEVLSHSPGILEEDRSFTFYEAFIVLIEGVPGRVRLESWLEGEFSEVEWYGTFRTTFTYLSLGLTCQFNTNFYGEKEI